ncbi:hypothetical protein ES332_D10G203000v1 [Gossypium tomentosum]|uniref:Uncharacterized protein n=1 Tax=Gossypium tomentosum TaxID=34277 RepID=A0A5D2J7U7_GOSTO|nr:hypothetical protein ES332_D10G203000v1 [Gossypium tomentosum]
MNLVRLVKAVCARPSIREIMGPLQVQAFQHDFVPRDPNAKSKRFKYPQVYDPYGPRPPPSDKVYLLSRDYYCLKLEFEHGNGQVCFGYEEMAA